jgi:hypothetical protein
MSAADFFAMYDVPVPEGFHFASVTGVSADGNTFVGAGLEPDGFLNMPWMVRLDTSVPTFLSFFDVQVSDGAVDLSFDVNGDALSIADFEVVVEYNGMEWTLPITRQGSAYVATDDSPELRQGGSATYSLYVIEDGNRSLVSSKSVDLDVMPAILTELKGAYPNPFNPMTKVAFSMANEGHVELSVYDASGRRVAVLANETFGAGDHTVTWQGRDDGGRALASGTYFVQMKSGSIYQHQKVNLVK